jgi:hypothetical protein
MKAHHNTFTHIICTAYSKSFDCKSWIFACA